MIGKINPMSNTDSDVAYGLGGRYNSPDRRKKLMGNSPNGVPGKSGGLRRIYSTRRTLESRSGKKPDVEDELGGRYNSPNGVPGKEKNRLDS